MFARSGGKQFTETGSSLEQIHERSVLESDPKSSLSDQKPGGAIGRALNLVQFKKETTIHAL